MAVIAGHEPGEDARGDLDQWGVRAEAGHEAGQGQVVDPAACGSEVPLGEVGSHGLGKAVKTCFLIDYLGSEALRREIHEVSGTFDVDEALSYGSCCEGQGGGQAARGRRSVRSSRKTP